MRFLGEHWRGHNIINNNHLSSVLPERLIQRDSDNRNWLSPANWVGVTLSGSRIKLITWKLSFQVREVL